MPHSRLCCLWQIHIPFTFMLSMFMLIGPRSVVYEIFTKKNPEMELSFNKFQLVKPYYIKRCRARNLCLSHDDCEIKHMWDDLVRSAGSVLYCVLARIHLRFASHPSRHRLRIASDYVRAHLYVDYKCTLIGPHSLRCFKRNSKRSHAAALRMLSDAFGHCRARSTNLPSR